MTPCHCCSMPFITHSDPWLAWKSGPSGDTAVNSFSIKERKKANKVKAVSSGIYSWFQGK